uniref:Cytochrome b5 n=1 Tax=Petromyzon marinus TaxID=7757 RepID=S4R582_PETMA
EASRLVSLDEVRKHCTSESTWIVLHDKVYDVTSFLDKHPGGTAVLLDRGGQDATNVFEDEGHTLDARELAKGFVVGKVHPKDLKILEKDRAVGLKESKVKPASTNSALYISTISYNTLMGLLIVVIVEYMPR